MPDFGEITIDQTQLDQAESRLRNINNGFPRAFSRALNRTSVRAKTRGIQDIRLDVGLTTTYLRTVIWSSNDRFENKATFSNLQSKVSARRRGLRLFNFLRSQIWAQPIRTRVKPAGASHVWNNAFFLRLRSGTLAGGSLGIFIRENRELKHLYGPSPSQVWTEVHQDIMPEMQDYLQEQLETEVNGVLRQYG